MLELDVIENKQAHYSEMIQSLLNKDIEAEADLRLQAEKERIVAQIKDEVNADIIKCKHYLEILDELKTTIKQDIETKQSTECVSASNEEGEQHDN